MVPVVSIDGGYVLDQNKEGMDWRPMTPDDIAQVDGSNPEIKPYFPVQILLPRPLPIVHS